MENQQLCFFLEVPEENKTQLTKKALLKAPLSKEEKVALDCWDFSHQSALESKILSRSLQILTTQLPESREWLWEAAWVFEPQLNFPEGVEQALSFKRVSEFRLLELFSLLENSNEVSDFYEVPTLEERKKMILEKMRPESKKAIKNKMYRKDNPYPFGEV